MTAYAKIVNGEATYPYRISDLRHDNPESSFADNALENPDIRNVFGIEEVTEESTPTTKPGWKPVKLALKNVGGSWVDSWELQPKVESELFDNDYTNWNLSDSISPDQLEDSGGSEVSLDGLPVVTKEGYVDGSAWVTDHWERVWKIRDLSYVEKRKNAYGDPWDQLEYIAENGIDSWTAKVSAIKERYPKA